LWVSVGQSNHYYFRARTNVLSFIVLVVFRFGVALNGKKKVLCSVSYFLRIAYFYTYSVAASDTLFYTIVSLSKWREKDFPRQIPLFMIRCAHTKIGEKSLCHLCAIRHNAKAFGWLDRFCNFLESMDWIWHFGNHNNYFIVLK